MIKSISAGFFIATYVLVRMICKYYISTIYINKYIQGIKLSFVKTTIFNSYIFNKKNQCHFPHNFKLKKSAKQIISIQKICIFVKLFM